MITMFDYQQGAHDKVMANFQSENRSLVVMATGLGKTIVAGFYAKKRSEQKWKGLFLCHNTNILDQSKREFRRIIGEKVRLADFHGSDSEVDWDADKADIVFASFQKYNEWKNAFHEDEFDYIIVDESHHGQAPTYKEVILYFKPKELLGITATPDREDLKDIRDIFGPEVVDISLEEAIAKGYLAKVEYHVMDDALNYTHLKKILSEVLEKGRRFAMKNLNTRIFVDKRDRRISLSIKKFAGTKKKTIIFCQGIGHAENFKHFIPGAKTCHSENPESKNNLDDFREGKLQTIIAVNQLNEGVDIPDAEVIVFLRCTDSKTIFFQQLGRGLRKLVNKEKVIVLDFVANWQRVAVVKELANKVKEFASDLFVPQGTLLHVSGEAFDFVFDDSVVDILEIIKRIKEPFYETWQEASEAAIKLGIKSCDEYHQKYRFDCKLPSHPRLAYKDFPKWEVFLKKEKPEIYPTWEEASRAAIALGIKKRNGYKKKYKADPRLRACPNLVYADFPGWKKFLDNYYKTWQEASEVAVSLGIKDQGDYQKKYRLDSRLPPSIYSYYKDFPGLDIFLQRLYPTWQEASSVAIRLKVIDSNDYKRKYQKDFKLHHCPRKIYKDFPGWDIFLGRTTSYLTWQEASKAAIGLGGINGRREYGKKYKLDPKLPPTPNLFYKDFPGWDIFLEKTIFYSTWQKASKATLGLKIVSKEDYGKNYKKDPKLPASPRYSYEDFPGWKVFLGKKK